ncbi:hypothetical protein ACWKWK_16640 [Pseudoxanthomonas beigongshangi]
MPVTPNYAFEKRQRELAKKKKLEEKLSRKRDVNAPSSDASMSEPEGTAGSEHRKVTTPPAAAPRIHRKRPV